MRTDSPRGCLTSNEQAAYMAGIVYGMEKIRIEKHLSKCNSCFELFITVFNHHLDRLIPKSELEIPDGRLQN